MRIRIDEQRCQGHARCAALVPELFDVDVDGYGLVRPGCDVVAEGDERALLAVENCPEEAISVEPGG